MNRSDDGREVKSGKQQLLRLAFEESGKAGRRPTQQAVPACSEGKAGRLTYADSLFDRFCRCPFAFQIICTTTAFLDLVVLLTHASL
jgi:hypothetical protein